MIPINPTGSRVETESRVEEFNTTANQQEVTNQASTNELTIVAVPEVRPSVDATGRRISRLQTIQNKIQNKLSSPADISKISEEDRAQLSTAKKCLSLVKDTFRGADFVSAKAASAVYGVLGFVAAVITDVVAAAVRGAVLGVGAVITVAAAVVIAVVGAPALAIYAAVKGIQKKNAEKKELAEQTAAQARLDHSISKLLLGNASVYMSSNIQQDLRSAIAVASQYLPRVSADGQEETTPSQFPETEGIAKFVVNILTKRLDAVIQEEAKQAERAAIAQAEKQSQQDAEATAQRDAIARREAAVAAPVIPVPVVNNAAPVIPVPVVNNAAPVIPVQVVNNAAPAVDEVSSDEESDDEGNEIPVAQPGRLRAFFNRIVNA